MTRQHGRIAHTASPTCQAKHTELARLIRSIDMHAHHPTTLEGALAAVATGAMPLAGGTDIMVEANFGLTRPMNVVGLRRIAELQECEEGRIGSGVTWERLETMGPRALAQAARTIGSPQIRNAGTIGGNLATASPAGDGHPFLAAVDADIELASASGRRVVHWSEFFLDVKKTTIKSDELISAILLPGELPERHEFAKIGTRNAMVISTVSAVVSRREDGQVTVALGSVAPTPIRARRAEEMMSSIGRPTTNDLAQFARLVSDEVRPITDHRSTEEYRRHAAGVLCKRLLARCLR